MQDIHIPVKWIAFWRHLRRLRGGGGGGGAVDDSGNGGFFFFSLPRNKRKETIDTSLASLL